MKSVSTQRVLFLTLFVPAAFLGVVLGNWASRPAKADDPPKETKAVVEQNRIVKLHVLAGDKVFTSCVEVPYDLAKNLPTGNKAEQKWEAVMYRLSDKNKVESFSVLGDATYVSPTQIGVEVHKDAKMQLKECEELLSPNDVAKRHAVMLLPKGSAKAKVNFVGYEHADFEKELAPTVKEGGLILVPVQLGVTARATTCTCKAFFGCTTGCCTNPTCNVVVGFCQSNSDCKKMDTFSN
ncbi:MAG: hypothetical protein ACRCZF_05805, partial [Gemmataceae bacterium]